MPRKRKAAAAAKKSDEPSTKKPNKTTPNDGTEDTATTSQSGPSMKDRLQKLQDLKRRRMTEVEQGNRRDRNLEYQKSKENPRMEAHLERKRGEALKLQEKQEAKDKGEDYERKQFWKYSAESVAAWEKKMEKKAMMANHGFTDHTQSAHRKYLKQTADFKPDLAGYQHKKMEAMERRLRNGQDPFDESANDLEYASVDDKPSEEAVDRLVADVKEQIRKRETRSRDRKETNDDISWINEKNRIFNRKLSRFYDRYTKEIRENLERGTAL